MGSGERLVVESGGWCERLCNFLSNVEPYFEKSLFHDRFYNWNVKMQISDLNECVQTDHTNLVFTWLVSNLPPPSSFANNVLIFSHVLANEKRNLFDVNPFKAAILHQLLENIS